MRPEIQIKINNDPKQKEFLHIDFDTHPNPPKGGNGVSDTPIR